MAFKRRGADIFDMSGLSVIEPRPDTYEADPFLLEHKGINYIFYEYYNYDKGVIAYRGIYPTGKVSDPFICLERPYHLSFPFLIKDGGEIYMVPETGQANCIEIYRAAKFPDTWQRVKTLVPDVCAGDSVIYKREDGYFLFTTLDGDHKPIIYQADSLLGEYKKVWSSEILNSRPAGNMYRIEDKIYKPVQEGLENYGRAVIIKEVSFFPYQEKEIAKIEPDWWPGLIGCHTFNFNNKYIVVDGKIKL